MINAELLCATRMRLEGASWEQIGARLAYDPRYIRKCLFAKLDYKPRRERDIVYPHIEDAIEADYGGSISTFAQAMGVSRQCMTQMLTGDIPLSRHILAEIQAATGLSDKEIMERNDGIE